MRNTPLVPSDVPVADLRGHWYLGVYNNERTNITYTIRAALPDYQGILDSGQPLPAGTDGAAVPERAVAELELRCGRALHHPIYPQPGLAHHLDQCWHDHRHHPLHDLPDRSGARPGFYRTVQVYYAQPKLAIQLWGTNQVRISWSTAFPGYTLQSKLGLFGTWVNAIPPATVPVVIGNMYVVYDTLGGVPKYYRLLK